MTSLLESEAALRAKALEHGLTEAELNTLTTKGLTTLSKLAFSITTPGINPSEDSLRSLLNSASPGDVTLGSLSSLRRLMFESQTLSIHQVKTAIENTEPTKRPELVPAERQARIRDQKARLAGYDLTGPLECSHSSYDLVGDMLQKDSVLYLAPTKFGTRASEVAKEKPPKELVIDSSSHLTVTSGRRDDKCSVASDLLLAQAFTRRALAFDLMSGCTFSAMEGWHRFLFSHLEHQPVVGYSHVTSEQLIKADKQAWVRLAEILPSLKKQTNGSLPLDKALQDLRHDPSVVFLLLPLPAVREHTKPHAKTPRNTDDKRAPEPKSKLRRTKGGGKGRGQKGSEAKMPAEIRGLKSNTSTGERICWNYNLPHQQCTFAQAGGTCKRGKHVCMKCEAAHPQYEHS